MSSLNSSIRKSVFKTEVRAMLYAVFIPMSVRLEFFFSIRTEDIIHSEETQKLYKIHKNQLELAKQILQ